jgi:hypothetical protein
MSARSTSPEEVTHAKEAETSQAPLYWIETEPELTEFITLDYRRKLF